MELRVTRPVIDRMLSEAKRASPEECCGILFGQNGVIEEARRAANVAADRRRRFEIDPQALVAAHRAARGGGPAILGYYHSHPAGSAEPSTVDRQEAGRDGRVWAIVGAAAVTFWRDGEAGFEPLSYTLVDR